MTKYHSPKSKKSGAIRVFKIAGIQISIDYSWFFIFFLIFWTLSAGYFPYVHPGQTAWYYLSAGFIASFFFFLSVLLHELAHSFMAIHKGIHIPEITLFIFGGVSKLSEEAKTAGTEFKIAIVGPLMSFGLAFIFWLTAKALEGPGEWAMFFLIFQYLAWINLALAIFNLMPGFPLDGGRVLRAAIWRRTGSLMESTRVASTWGKGFGVALMLFGVIQIFAGALIGGIWLIIIGLFLRSMAQVSYESTATRLALADIPVQDVMISEVRTIPAKTPLSAVLEDYFLKYFYHGFPIEEEGRITGILNLEDIQNVPIEERPLKTAKDFMRPLDDQLHVPPQMLLSQVLEKMNEENISRLVVMEGSHMRGFVSKSTVMRFIQIHDILTSSQAPRGKMRRG